MIVLRTGVKFDNSTRCLALDGQTDLPLYRLAICRCTDWRPAAVQTGDLPLYRLATCRCTDWRPAAVQTGDLPLCRLATCRCADWRPAAVQTGDLPLCRLATCRCADWRPAAVQTGDLPLYRLAICRCTDWRSAAVQTGDLPLYHQLTVSFILKTLSTLSILNKIIYLLNKPDFDRYFCLRIIISHLVCECSWQRMDWQWLQCRQYRIASKPTLRKVHTSLSSWTLHAEPSIWV